MGLTYIEIPITSSTTLTYTVPFTVIDASDIHVYLAGVELSTASGFTVSNSNTLITLTNAPAVGALLVIKRQTKADAKLVDFQAGAMLTEADLDLAVDQVFNLGQESKDRAEDSIVKGFDGKMDAQGRVIKNVADGVAATDAVTKGQVDIAYPKIEVVADNLADILVVKNDIANVNTTATNIASVNTVATNIAKVTTVVTDIAKVNAVGADLLLGVDMAAVAVRMQQIITQTAPYDALTTLLYEVAEGYKRGDVDNDGDIDINDTNDVLQFVAGITSAGNAEYDWIADNILAPMAANPLTYGQWFKSTISIVASIATPITNAAGNAATATQQAVIATAQATASANSAITASSVVNTLNTLGYFKDWGLITATAGSSTDYGTL